eukprot:gnl/TRDRNA2_/TRDRNA2_166879_c2_seq3.p1 gnl/TRDRNA2_/TRDRNA2_166879_c2~~gnl/TRDRNA2_/TRDRNA2_166879_c2_seq3.p1  ORF type:complete len:152 (+),score=32.48 gnl/TRDRNA2_/TRDRNA2_166879_c2_seq3:163-618(+)
MATIEQAEECIRTLDGTTPEYGPGKALIVRFAPSPTSRKEADDGAAHDEDRRAAEAVVLAEESHSSTDSAKRVLETADDDRTSKQMKLQDITGQSTGPSTTTSLDARKIHFLPMIFWEFSLASMLLALAGAQHMLTAKKTPRGCAEHLMPA